MDEPLSNLDARLREQMRVELKKITKSIGVTTLYVTHDQAEALSLGDKVCVMNHGEILQMAEPVDVYARPANLFVAQFVGEMNFISGSLTGPGRVECAVGDIELPIPNGITVGSTVTLAIRPEHVMLMAPEANSGTVRGRIITKNYLGDSALLEVDVNGVMMLVKLGGDCALSVGDEAALDLPVHRWHVFPERN
jgi:ABC-type sugar transport system ATPase subunit